MDGPLDKLTQDDGSDEPPMPAQADLERMFDADDADVLAGRTIPGEHVLAEIRATAAQVRLTRAENKAKAPPQA